MTNSASNKSEEVQVEILPERLLNPETAQKLLNELSKVEGIIKVVIHGPRLPLTVPAGPGRGEIVDHDARQIIQVADTALELTIYVGRIRLEVDNADVKEEVRSVCERILPFSFEFRVGHYFQAKPTVSDYARYGPDADKKLLGLTDPKRKARNDQICFLGSTE